MSTRQPYDEERVVRQSEIHDEPTEVIRTAGVVNRREHYVERDADAVVVEHPVGYVERPVGYVGGVGHEYEANAVREDVTIDHVVERRAMLDRVSQIIWFVAGLLEAALGLRIVFRLLEANEASGFVRFIYGLTDPFVAPFSGIFADPGADGAVLDTAAVVAMIIYALATWALVRLIWLLFDRPETGARRSVSQYHSDRI